MSITQVGQALRFEDFLRIFAISVASTPAQRAVVHGIRYKVYCHRFGFEDGTAFPDGEETDAFDEHAVHLLVTHRATGVPAGCARLVLAGDDRPTPTEALFRNLSPAAALQMPGARRHRLAEISRLAVDAPFSRDRRLSPAETTRGRRMFSRAERAVFPLVGVALFLAAGAVGDLLRRTDCIALMEPPLHSLLRRAGIRVHPAGQTVMHRGARTPYFLDIDDTVATMASGIRHGYELTKARVAHYLTAPGSTSAPEIPSVGESLTTGTQPAFSRG